VYTHTSAEKLMRDNGKEACSIVARSL